MSAPIPPPVSVEVPPASSSRSTTTTTADRALLLRRVLYGTVIALYVLAFPWHPALRSPNELCRLWQTRALVEYGTLDLNETIRTWGYVGDLSRFDNKLYPSKAPLLSFAAVPLYASLKAIGGGGRYAVPEIPLVFWSRLFFTILPTLVMLIFVRRFLRTFVSDAIADALTATYALGSLAFSYSLLFMSHQTTAVLVFGAFYALWRSLRGDWKRPWLGYLVCGALCGATVAAEYTGALPVIALFLYGIVAALTDRSRPMRERLIRLGTAGGLAVVGALPFVGGLMWYHSVCFGGPFESGYKHLNDAGYQPWHMGGFLGIRFPDPRAFLLSFFSPLRGLFTLSPFLLLSLAGLPQLRGRHGQDGQAGMRDASSADRALLFFTALLLLGYTYFTSSFSYDSWGWTTGPRHLTPLVPFLLLPIALLLKRLVELDRKPLLGIAAGLCAGSIVVTGALSLIDYIPDSTSNAFFALAVPLFRDGYLPPSILTALVPNPLSGALLLVLLGAAAALTFFVLVRSVGTLAPSAIAAGLVVFACYLTLLSSSTRHDDADRGALNHLRSAWIAPAGKGFEFWPDPR